MKRMELGYNNRKVKVLLLLGKGPFASSFLFPRVDAFLFSKLALNPLVNQGMP